MKIKCLSEVKAGGKSFLLVAFIKKNLNDKWRDSGIITFSTSINMFKNIYIINLYKLIKIINKFIQP